MSNAPIDDNSGKAYWQIADQIPTVHHWPASDRLPVDDSLPRHAFDIRRGVQSVVDFVLGYALRFRLGQYLFRKFGRSGRNGYPCVTCGLPYSVNPVDKRLDE